MYRPGRRKADIPMSPDDGEPAEVGLTTICPNLLGVRDLPADEAQLRVDDRWLAPFSLAFRIWWITYFAKSLTYYSAEPTSRARSALCVTRR